MLKLVLVNLAIAITVSSQAVQAEELPRWLITEDTVCIVSIDMRKIDIEAAQASAAYVLFSGYFTTSNSPPPLIREWPSRHAMLLKAEVDRAVIVMRCAKHADRAKWTRILALRFSGQPDESEEEMLRNWVGKTTERQDDWWIWAIEPGFDSEMSGQERFRAFTAALEAAGNSPVKCALVPNPALRESCADSLKYPSFVWGDEPQRWLVFLDAEYVGLRFDLDMFPTAHIVFQNRTAKEAKELWGFCDALARARRSPFGVLSVGTLNERDLRMVGNAVHVRFDFEPFSIPPVSANRRPPKGDPKLSEEYARHWHAREFSFVAERRRYRFLITVRPPWKATSSSYRSRMTITITRPEPKPTEPMRKKISPWTNFINFVNGHYRHCRDFPIDFAVGDVFYDPKADQILLCERPELGDGKVVVSRHSHVLWNHKALEGNTERFAQHIKPMFVLQSDDKLFDWDFKRAASQPVDTRPSGGGRGGGH